MIKVLHYIPGFLYGGIESMFLEWYKNTDKSNFQFELLIRTQDDNAPALLEYKKLGGNYYRLAPIKDFFRYRKSAKQFFQQHYNYDILHAHGLDPYVFYYAKRFGIPIIVTHSHTADVDPSIKEKIKFYDDKYLMCKYANYGFACSEKASQFTYGGQTFKHKPVSIIHNAINTNAFVYNQYQRDKIREEMNLKDKLVIGHVGRLTYQKNQYYLFDIFKEVVNRYKNSIMMLIGDGYEKKGLLEYSAKLDLKDKVIYLGETDKVSDYMQAMDCFVLPSRWEGLPVTLIEAQAAGLPCFVSEEVTKEADLVASIVFRKSLEDKPKIWANEIYSKTIDFVRCNTQQRIIESGYDIKTEIKKLEKVYKDIVKEQ